MTGGSPGLVLGTSSEPALVLVGGREAAAEEDSAAIGEIWSSSSSPDDSGEDALRFVVAGAIVGESQGDGRSGDGAM